VRYTGIADSTDEFRSRHAQATSTSSLSRDAKSQLGTFHSAGQPDQRDGDGRGRERVKVGVVSNVTPSGSPGV
jgi:hypothetical protein